jgi:mRNA deadenylase 3'-5' endonuclease subunit Ccr4
MNGETGEPYFSNFAKNFRGMLDYILYNTTNLKVVSLLEMIDKEEVKDDGLPSLNHSSDHIPIETKFCYISNQKPANKNNICSNDGQLQGNLLKVHKTEKT